MRETVLYIIAVALGVFVTPYIASIVRLTGGLAEVGVLLVVVFLINLALGLIPWPPARA